MSEKQNRGKLIAILIAATICSILYNILSAQSTNQAEEKIKEVQTELNLVKDSLQKSTERLSQIIEKLNTSEVNLNIIKSRVQTIDYNYQLSKIKSVSEIKEIKEKINLEEVERKKLIKELEKFK